MIENAQNYKGYKLISGRPVEGTSALTPSTATTIEALVKEIKKDGTAHVYGDKLPANLLVGEDALIKLFIAVKAKFSQTGLTIDKNHPSIPAGINAGEIIAIMPGEIADEISNTKRVTQIMNLPGGMSTNITSVNGIQIVEDPMVREYLGGDAKIIFIRKASYVYVKNALQGKEYAGLVETGNVRALVVQKEDGTVGPMNTMPYHVTLTSNTTHYVAEVLKGTAVVIKTAAPSKK
jgi:hypothetical protein